MVSYHRYYLLVNFDELIALLKKNGLSCHIGTGSFWTLGYTDDYTLIFRSLNALNHMLSIYTDFGKVTYP